MDIHLVVVSPFGDYATGDCISDAAEIERHKDSERVVRIAAPSAGDDAAPHATDTQEG